MIALGRAWQPDLLGTARHRQDHRCAPAGQRDRSCLRADLGDFLGRRRSEEGLRGRARPPPERARHAAFRRRDPPLQPRAAGQFPARDGRRHHRARRRDDGEPVLRTQRRPAVARQRARLSTAGRRRRLRNLLARAETGRGQAAAARRGSRAIADRAWPMATAARCSDARRGNLARRARRARRSTPRSLAGDRAAPRARSTTRAQDGHYNLISALHKSVRGSDPDAALYYLARMLDAGEDPLFHRAPPGAHGESRTSALPIRRRW